MSTLYASINIGYTVHMTTNTDDQVLTPKQAAALMGVSRQTVARLLKAGTLVPIAPPNPALQHQRLRVRRSEVERYLAARAALLALAPAPR